MTTFDSLPVYVCVTFFEFYAFSELVRLRLKEINNVCIDLLLAESPKNV